MTRLEDETDSEEYSPTPEELREKLVVAAGEPVGTLLSDQELRVKYREIHGTLVEQVQRSLSVLDPREQAVLRMRFGLDDSRQRFLREVGEEMGFSKSTAWRVEKSALLKLRKSPQREVLKNSVGLSE